MTTRRTGPMDAEPGLRSIERLLETGSYEGATMAVSFLEHSHEHIMSEEQLERLQHVRDELAKLTSQERGEVSRIPGFH